MDKLIIGPHEILTRVAVYPEELEQGLMYASWPPPILSFAYLKPQIRKFWMKNTPSPLDIIFSFQGKIINICQGVPFSLESIGPNKFSDLVVEMPAGMTNLLNISLDQNIKLYPSLKTAAKHCELVLINKNL